MTLGSRLLGSALTFIIGISCILYLGFVVKVSNVSLLFDPRQITPVSPLYYVKTSRESLQTLFVFGEIDVAWRHLQLAEKRLSEAQILSDRQLYSFANAQMHRANLHMKSASSLMSKLSKQTNTTFLTDKFEQNSRKLSSLGYKN